MWRKSYIKLAILCLDNTLHIGVGEVAASPRPSVGQQHTCVVPTSVGQQHTCVVPKAVGQQHTCTVSKSVGQQHTCVVPKAVGQQHTCVVPKSVGQQHTCVVPEAVSQQHTCVVSTAVGQQHTCVVPKAVGQQHTCVVPKSVGQQHTCVVPKAAGQQHTCVISKAVGQQHKCVVPKSVDQQPTCVIPKSVALHYAEGEATVFFRNVGNHTLDHAATWIGQLQSCRTNAGCRTRARYGVSAGQHWRNLAARNAIARRHKTLAGQNSTARLASCTTQCKSESSPTSFCISALQFLDVSCLVVSATPSEQNRSYETPFSLHINPSNHNIFMFTLYYTFFFQISDIFCYTKQNQTITDYLSHVAMLQIHAVE